MNYHYNYKNYVKLLPDMKKAKIYMEELKNKITEFKGILDDLINRLNKVKNTIDYFYQIKKQLFDLVVNKCINYEILSSFNRINKSEIINYKQFNLYFLFFLIIVNFLIKII